MQQCTKSDQKQITVPCLFGFFAISGVNLGHWPSLPRGYFSSEGHAVPFGILECYTSHIFDQDTETICHSVYNWMGNVLVNVSNCCSWRFLRYKLPKENFRFHTFCRLFTSYNCMKYWPRIKKGYQSRVGIHRELSAVSLLNLASLSFKMHWGIASASLVKVANP